VNLVKTRGAYRLGDLQLSILKVLWQLGEATVAGTQEALGARDGVAYTTVATILRRMEERGLVLHRCEGRSFIYRAAVAAETVSRGMADHWMERLHQGSLTEAVNHLLTTREISRGELKELQRLIAEKLKRR
jgi:BlaI family transcriptional regulator, penicillinase repressor